MRFPKCRGVLLCALVLCTFIPLHAQQNSEINGIVTDPTGNAIVGARVTLTDEGTGNARNATTDSAGLFTFPALNVGTYTELRRQHHQHHQQQELHAAQRLEREQVLQQWVQIPSRHHGLRGSLQHLRGYGVGPLA